MSPTQQSATSRRTWLASASPLWALGGVLVAAVLAVASLWSVLIPIAAVGVVLMTLLVLRIGVAPAAVILALVFMAFAAFFGRYAAIAYNLNAIGTVMFIAIGISVLPRVRVSREIAVPTIVLWAIGTLSAIVWAFTSPEFAFRGWTALFAAIFSTIAVLGALSSPTSSPAKIAKARGAIVATLVLITTANIVIALRQAISGLTYQEERAAIEGGSTYRVGDQIRLMGVFESNQDMGVFLSCFAPAFLVLALRSSNRRMQALAYLISASLYVVTLLSLTRTALIASAVAGVIALLVWGKGEVVLRIFRNVAAITVGVVVLALVLAQLNIPRVQDAVTRALTLTNVSEDGSFLDRLYITLPVAWAAFLRNPLGSGVGSAGPVSAQFPSVAPYGYTNADNGYLNIAIQVGIVGVIAFVVMLVALLRHLGRVGDPIQNAAAGGVLALMIAMLTAGYWSLLAPMCLLGALVGLGLASRGPTVRPELSDRHLDRSSQNLARKYW